MSTFLGNGRTRSPVSMPPATLPDRLGEGASRRTVSSGDNRPFIALRTGAHRGAGPRHRGRGGGQPVVRTRSSNGWPTSRPGRSRQLHPTAGPPAHHPSSRYGALVADLDCCLADASTTDQADALRLVARRPTLRRRRHRRIRRLTDIFTPDMLAGVTGRSTSSVSPGWVPSASDPL